MPSLKIGKSLIVLMAVVTMVMGSSCSSPSARGAKQVSIGGDKAPPGKVTEAQLQEELFRFANRFSGDVREGLRELENSPNPQIRNQALLRRIMYNSAALDICLGPSPEANLLDMLAFVQLSQQVWDDYWVPEVFKEPGRPLSNQFKRIVDEAWRIGGQVLNDEQRSQIRNIVQRWRQQHSSQIAVENVRFSEFAVEAGGRAKEMQDEVGGILSSVQGATVVGDRALLFSERALFYAQRAPFLLRMQAQAGTREVLTEAMGVLAPGQEILNQSPHLHAILNDLNVTLASASRLLSQATDHPEAIKSSGDIVRHFADVLREWNDIQAAPSVGARSSQLAGIAESVDARANRMLWKVFGVGCGFIILSGLVLFAALSAYWWMTRRYMRRRRARLHLSKDREAA
ncbi:MAG: hypothetical protein ACJ763_08440 [Bdellovibrionia bacterium]